MNYEEIKNQLDSINDQMLQLFIRQLELVNQAAKHKQAEGKAHYDRKREEEILETAVANSPMNMQSYSLEFFRTVINLDKEYIKDNK